MNVDVKSYAKIIILGNYICLISSHLRDLFFLLNLVQGYRFPYNLTGRFSHIEVQDVDDGSESDSEVSDESDPEDLDDSDD